MRAWTLIHPTTLRLQGRRAWDMSALWLNPDSRATALAQSEAFYRVLQRAHRLPAALRADLLLFDELDMQRTGEEQLLEPLPPPAAVDLEALTDQRDTPIPVSKAVPWLLRLLDTLARLVLHGLPPHLMLRPQCVYVTTTEQVILAELGLSVLVPTPLPPRLVLPPGLLEYAAPELLGRHAAMRGDLADVYAVGHIAARLLLPRSELAFLAAKDPRDKYLLAPPNFAAAKGLDARVAVTLTAMCDTDPQRRPSLLAAYAELRRASSADAGVLSFAVSVTDTVDALANRLIGTLVLGDAQAVRATSAELVARSASWDPLARRALQALEPSFGQLLDGAPALSSAALSQFVASFGAVLTAAEQLSGLRTLACIGLIGIGLYHIADMDPMSATAILMQARSLLERTGGGSELLHGLLCAAEVEAALAAGRGRELRLARESLAKPLVDVELQALTLALRALVELSLGQVAVARATRAEAERTVGGTNFRGLLRHALARLDLQLELTELPLGVSVGAAGRWPERTRRLLCRLSRAELASRILPQIDPPGALLCRTFDRPWPRRAGGTSPRSAVWRDCLVRGIRCELTNLQGSATAYYLRALALLPADAASVQHIELYAWLASAHRGVSPEYVAERYLAPAAAWLGRSLAAPSNLSSPLQDALRFFPPRAEPSRSPQPPPSLLEGLDAEVLTSPRRVAHWIMARLFGEFHGLCATMTLLKLGNVPLNGGTVRPESSGTSFEAALVACGWFNETPATERVHVCDRLREVVEREPLHAPLALSVVTVLARPLADLEELARTRRALCRAAGLLDPPPGSGKEGPLLPEQLIEQVNAALAGVTRRLHVIPSPLDPDVLHVAFVDPAAFKAAIDAGLLYSHFAAEYIPSSELVELEDSRRASLSPAMRALREVQYDGQPLAFECDALACRAQISQGVFAELRFSAHLYRTFNEDTRRALAGRLAELVPAFMLVRQWADTAPPVPTQLRTLHLMAHEAKRPLLWMQRTLTRLCDTYQITLETYREMEAILDISVARLALFCGTKVWDFAEFELRRRVESLVDDWQIALRTNGEALTLLCTIEEHTDARPLWIRGQALELILSELLENTRKHSQSDTEIGLRLTTKPGPTHCTIDITIRNLAREALHGDTARAQLFVERYGSTGLGIRLLSDLVHQLDGGRISGSRDLHDPRLHVTHLSFTAPYLISTPTPELL